MAKPFQPANIGLFRSYIPNYKAIAEKDLSSGARVYSDKPNEVVYDPRLPPIIPNIFEHEFEHQLNRKAGARYGENFEKKSTRPEYKYWEANLYDLGVNPKNATERFANAVQMNAPYISKLYKEKTGKDLSLQSRIWDASNEDLSEILAELSSIESVVKMDFTKDPVLRKKIFGDNKLTEPIAQVYRSVTGGRQDRLDAKDLEPYTTQKQERSFFDYLKDLKFTNPFGDSTKD